MRMMCSLSGVFPMIEQLAQLTQLPVWEWLSIPEWWALTIGGLAFGLSELMGWE